MCLESTTGVVFCNFTSVFIGCFPSHSLVSWEGVSISAFFLLFQFELRNLASFFYYYCWANTFVVPKKYAHVTMGWYKLPDNGCGIGEQCCCTGRCIACFIWHVQHINMVKLDGVLKGLNLTLQWWIKVVRLYTDSLCVYHWLTDKLTCVWIQLFSFQLCINSRAD